ncbi:hypothetical protein Tco_0260962 [Tanacetum coccineum]
MFPRVSPFPAFENVIRYLGGVFVHPRDLREEDRSDVAPGDEERREDDEANFKTSMGDERNRRMWKSCGRRQREIEMKSECTASIGEEDSRGRVTTDGRNDRKIFSKRAIFEFEEEIEKESRRGEGDERGFEERGYTERAEETEKRSVVMKSYLEKEMRNSMREVIFGRCLKKNVRVRFETYVRGEKGNMAFGGVNRHSRGRGHGERETEERSVEEEREMAA